MRVLLLESDPDLAHALSVELRAEGYALDVAGTVGEALRWRREVDYDCLVVDREMVDGDALALVDGLRRSSDSVPIVVLSDRAGGLDRLHGLEIGADDYLAKPVSVDELVLRVRKILIRSTREARSAALRREVVGRVSIARGLREVRLDDEPVVLTATQYCLVEFLLTHRHREVTADEMVEHCWDAHLPSSSRPLPPQLTRVRAAFRGALTLELVRWRTYRVQIEGERVPAQGP